MTMLNSVLVRRIALAVLSGYGMLLTNWIGSRLDSVIPLPYTQVVSYRWFYIDWETILGGALFGALVMVPLIVAPTQRIWRAVALCVSSILIFRLALGVGEGALGPLSIIAAGVIGAVLVSVAVVIVAPQKATWRLAVLAVLAGLLGGAAIKYAPAGDVFFFATAFAVWQVLVCLALNLAARDTAEYGVKAIA